MNVQAVRAIAEKDLVLVVRNPGVRRPLLGAPLVILIGLPILLIAGAEFIVTNSTLPIDMGRTVTRITPELQTAVTNYEGTGQWAVFVLEFFLAPLYLLVPLIVATVIAADSFAGERERGTLEALLHTPPTDEELFVGKVLAAWLPAVAVGVGGFAVYAAVANAVAWPYVGRMFFPTPAWLVLALWVGPAVAALGLGLIVHVSARVRTLQAAHQIGSLVVLPILLLVIAQVTGLLVLDSALLAVSGGVLWVLALAVIAAGHRTFRRDRMAAQLR